MRLERLIAELTDFVRAKVVENQIVAEDEVDATTATQEQIMTLAAQNV